jgi:murein DD-endopeptidase MepM/ murein hydrolase activator NlpD
MKPVSRRILFVLAILFVLPLTGIHAQGTVEPPPAAYSEVAEAYTALVDSTTAEGTAVVDLLLNGEFDTLYARFSADFQAQVTPEQLEEVYKQLTGTAPIGERIADRALLSVDQRIYAAQYVWGNSTVVFVAIFNEAGTIDGLMAQPVPALPDDPGADYQSTVTFRLPFDGLWYTFWGGPDMLHNQHVTAPPQRHAFDFLIWKDGSTFRGDGTAREDYYAYGQPVLAPADGTVITVVNDLPEVLPQVETDENNPAGNHVVIQVAEDAYLFMAHMQPGSIQVQEGDTVKAGQFIGLVGNSGNTSEPHLHIHLQSQPEMFVVDESGQITGFTDAIGLPLIFSNYLADGEPVESGEPLGGQFVQQAP